MIHKKLVTATGQRSIRTSRTGTKKEREFLLNNLLQVFVFQPFKKLNAFFFKNKEKAYQWYCYTNKHAESWQGPPVCLGAEQNGRKAA